MDEFKINKQMEFDFMYNIGEQIINRDTLQICSVVSKAENKEKDKGAFEVQYEDGSKEWLFSDQVTKILLETDPTPYGDQLSE